MWPRISPGRSGRRGIWRAMRWFTLYIAAISRKVADNVPEGVAQRVDIAEMPDLPGMLALVQHQVQMAKRLEGGKRPQ